MCVVHAPIHHHAYWYEIRFLVSRLPIAIPAIIDKTGNDAKNDRVQHQTSKSSHPMHRFTGAEGSLHPENDTDSKVVTLSRCAVGFRHKRGAEPPTSCRQGSDLYK